MSAENLLKLVQPQIFTTKVLWVLMTLSAALLGMAMPLFYAEYFPSTKPIIDQQTSIVIQRGAGLIGCVAFSFMLWITSAVAARRYLAPPAFMSGRHRRKPKNAKKAQQLADYESLTDTEKNIFGAIQRLTHLHIITWMIVDMMAVVGLLHALLTNSIETTLICASAAMLLFGVSYFLFAKRTLTLLHLASR